MFGFLKRKKKNTDSVPEKTDQIEKENTEPTKASPAKKKRLPVKLIIIIILVLVAVSGSGFVVYKFWFSAKSDENAKPVYKPIELVHVSLPEEMLRFSFDHFPVLYVAFVDFNREITLINQEIDRIEQIAGQYPEQEKIAVKEKKVWEKARDSLKKAFLKIEKPVKETYVLFRVHKEMGLMQIQEKDKDLTEAAQSALAQSKLMTERLKAVETVPEGLIKGTIYKLKKKFL